jgi:hypothetical protein
MVISSRPFFIQTTLSDRGYFIRSAKPYTLIFDERPQYLYALVTCDKITVGIAKSYLREIVDECRELQYQRLMIERDIPKRLPTSTFPALAADFVKLGIGDLKVAFVDKRINDLGLLRFAAAATRALGINVRVYRARPEARRWLIYSDG